MTKRDQLHKWLLRIDDWVYLAEVPYQRFDMSKEACSSALAYFCKQGRADYRIVGIKQYRANDVPPLKRGPKPPK